MLKELNDVFPKDGENVNVEGRLSQCIETYNEKSISLIPVYKFLWTMIKSSGREFHLIPGFFKVIRQLRATLKPENKGKEVSLIFGLPARGWQNTIYDNSYLAWIRSKKELLALRASCLWILRIEITIDGDGMAKVNAIRSWDLYPN